MSIQRFQYIVGKSRFMNAGNVMGNIKLNLPTTWRILPEDNVTELISLVKRYDKERQASSTHRIYGRLSYITTNELLDYNPSTVILSSDVFNKSSSTVSFLS